MMITVLFLIMVFIFEVNFMLSRLVIKDTLMRLLNTILTFIIFWIYLLIFIILK
jgi:hypothetical protein